MALVQSPGYRGFIKTLLYDINVDQIRGIIMDRLSGMWSQLQNERRLPKGVLTATCEAELKELMQQIDNMMEAKRVNWEQTVQNLETKLDSKEKENTVQKSALEQKCREINHLKAQLKKVEQAQKDGVKQYDTQLSVLNGEVQKMKRDYAKLHRRHNKDTKEAEKQKDKNQMSLQESAVEIERLKEKLEDYKLKAKDWELQKRTFQSQIETLDHQRKALNEKCEFVQNQSQTYQSQLERRRQMLDNTELNLKSQISQLEGQLERTNESLTLQEAKVEKLKTSLEEAINSHKKAMDDNEHLLNDLKKANDNVRRLEEEKRMMEGDVQSKDDFIRAVSEDSSNYQENVKRMEAALEEKDNIIRSLGEIHNQEESEQITSLRDSLNSSKEETRIYKKSEKRLKDEVTKLHSHLKKVVGDYETAAEELEKMKMEKDNLESEEVKKLRLEINQLTDELQSVQESHKAEIQGMNHQVKSLTSDLHDKEVTLATLSHQTGCLETQLREETEMYQKRTAELQVANAQIEALRLENRHLRQTVLQQVHKNADREHMEDHLRVIKTSYNTTVTKLEQENRQLTEEIQTLKDEMADMELRFEEQLQTALRDSENSARQDSLKRQLKLEEDNNKQIQAMQERLNSTVQRYEEQLRLVNTQKARLEDQLQSQRHSKYSRPPLEGSVTLHLDLEPEVNINNHYEPEQRVNGHPKEQEQSPLHKEYDAYSPMSRDSGRCSPHFSSPILKTNGRLSPTLHSKSPSFKFREHDHKLSYLENGPNFGSGSRTTNHLHNHSLSDDSSRESGTERMSDSEDQRLSNHDRKYAAHNTSVDTILSSRAMSISESLQEMGDHDIQSPRNSVSQKFLDAENKRAKELEMLIDSHIEDLKLGTDKIVKKYNRRR